MQVVGATYNHAAQSILKEQEYVVTKSSSTKIQEVVSSTANVFHESLESLDKKSLLDNVSVLQQDIRDGLIDPVTYDEKLSEVLKLSVAENQSDLKTIYTQLFSDQSTVPLPVDDQESGGMKSELRRQEEAHRLLHAKHVLPILQGTRQVVEDSESVCEETAIQVQTEVPKAQDVDPDMFACEVNLYPIMGWTDVARTLSECHAQAPLHFPHAVVCLLDLKFEALVGELKSRVQDSSALLFTSEKEEHIEVFRSITRAACALVKEDSPLYMSIQKPEIQLQLQQLRRLLKVAFHKSHQATRNLVVRILDQSLSVFKALKLMDAAWELEISRSVFERLFFKTSLSEAGAVCQALHHVHRHWLRPLAEEVERLPSAKLTVKATDKSQAAIRCASCKRIISIICIGENHGAQIESVKCVCCPLPEFNEDGTKSYNAWRVVQLDDESGHPTKPGLSAAHLLAHKQNVWETKVGTRHTVLPDKSQVVMSTAVRETSTRQYLSSMTGTTIDRIQQSPGVTEQIHTEIKHKMPNRDMITKPTATEEPRTPAPQQKETKHQSSTVTQTFTSAHEIINTDTPSPTTQAAHSPSTTESPTILTSTKLRKGVSTSTDTRAERKGVSTSTDTRAERKGVSTSTDTREERQGVTTSVDTRGERKGVSTSTGTRGEHKGVSTPADTREMRSSDTQDTRVSSRRVVESVLASGEAGSDNRIQVFESDVAFASERSVVQEVMSAGSKTPESRVMEGVTKSGERSKTCGPKLPAQEVIKGPRYLKKTRGRTPGSFAGSGGTRSFDLRAAAIKKEREERQQQS